MIYLGILKLFHNQNERYFINILYLMIIKIFYLNKKVKFNKFKLFYLNKIFKNKKIEEVNIQIKYIFNLSF